VGFPIQLENRPDEDSIPQQDLTKVSGAEQKMEGVHLVESRAGDRDWELYAEAAEGYQGQGKWELKNVRVLFYSKEDVQFTVTGNAGTIDTKTKDMNIVGDVKTLSSNGYRFQTSAVSYIARDRILRSKDKVKMVGPPDARGKAIILNGGNMETQIDNSVMMISDNVHAEKALENGKNFVIRSKGAEFSSKSFSARFFNQVSIELDTMKMEGPEANFQYDKGKDFLQSILVKGGVKVSDLDKYATSEQVRFEPLENKFILSGRPRVVQNNDEIQGDQIIFIDGGKKVKVENIRARMDKQ
jgi:LPS export ABC transporter protein LptC